MRYQFKLLSFLVAFSFLFSQSIHAKDYARRFPTNTPIEVNNPSQPNYLNDASVAHGMTDIQPTDAYGKLFPATAGVGGLQINGLTDTASSTGLTLLGIIGNADPTDTVPAISLAGGKKNGTTWQALGAAETVFQLKNYTTEIATVLGNGNVGIGTTNPGAKLDIINTSEQRFELSSTNNTTHWWKDTTPTKAFSVGLNKPGAASLSDDLVFSSFSGSTWTENARILNSSGNLGIGTSSPAARLTSHYAGIVSGEAPASSGTTPVNPMGRFSNNRDSALDIGGQYSSPFGLWLQVADVTNLGTYFPLLLQPNGGNVGIGTTNPSSYTHGGTNRVLEIFNSGATSHAQAHVILSTGSVLANSSVGSISWAVTNASSSDKLGALIAGVLGSTSTAANPTTALHFYTRNTSDSIPTSRMIITEGGNVGIGTTSPLAKIDIYTGNITAGNAPASSGTTPVNAMGRFSNNRGSTLDIGGQFDPPYGIWLQGTDNTNLGTYYPLLLQPNGGNVGIGTTSPAAKLAVISSSANAIAVSNSGSAPSFTDGVVNVYSNTAATYGIRSRVLDNSGVAGYFEVRNGVTGGGEYPIWLVRSHNGGVYETAGNGVGLPFYLEDTAKTLELDGEIRTIVTTAGSPNITDMLFATRNGATYSEKFRITGAGNIGIGTTSPTNILSLGGTSARTIWMERHTTSNTAGNNLTLQAGGATSGATDKDGGMLVLSPGATTGTGKTSVRIQRYLRATSTGTSDNSAYDAIIVPSEVPITDGVAKSLFEVALPTGGLCGGSIEYSIHTTDGTDHQSLTGYVTYSAVNKGGAYTTQITEVAGNQAKAVSAGTLTSAWTVLTGTNKITIQVTGDSSLTPTAFVIFYKVHNAGIQPVTQL